MVTHDENYKHTDLRITTNPKHNMKKTKPKHSINEFLKSKAKKKTLEAARIKSPDVYRRTDRMTADFSLQMAKQRSNIFSVLKEKRF